MSSTDVKPCSDKELDILRTENPHWVYPIGMDKEISELMLGAVPRLLATITEDRRKLAIAEKAMSDLYWDVHKGGLRNVSTHHWIQFINALAAIRTNHTDA